LQGIGKSTGCDSRACRLCAGDRSLRLRRWSLLGLGAKGASVMTFKVYSGPAGTDAVSPIQKDRMLFKEFPNFDEALSWASHIRDTGRIAVLIEEETGRTFNKREIAAALANRDARHVRGVAAHRG
jgi:hypothetical protein